MMLQQLTPHGQQEDRAELKTQVLAFLAEHAPVDLHRLPEHAGLLKEAALDSLQLIQLIVWLESRTGQPVEIDRLLVDNDVTLGAIVEYLASP